MNALSFYSSINVLSQCQSKFFEPVQNLDCISVVPLQKLLSDIDFSQLDPVDSDPNLKGFDSVPDSKDSTEDSDELLDHTEFDFPTFVDFWSKRS